MIDLDLDVKNHAEKTNDLMFYLRSTKKGEMIICLSTDPSDVCKMLHQSMHEDMSLKAIMFDSVLNHLDCMGVDELKRFKKIIKIIEKNHKK